METAVSYMPVSLTATMKLTMAMSDTRATIHAAILLKSSLVEREGEAKEQEPQRDGDAGHQDDPRPHRVDGHHGLDGLGDLGGLGVGQYQRQPLPEHPPDVAEHYEDEPGPRQRVPGAAVPDAGLQNVQPEGGHDEAQGYHHRRDVGQRHVRRQGCYRRYGTGRGRVFDQQAAGLE